MNLRRAIFPGSFDPLTNGHLDIIKRSLPLFDEIIIAVLNNPDKNPMFSVEERCRMIEEVLREVEKGECCLIVDSFQGLTADFEGDHVLFINDAYNSLAYDSRTLIRLFFPEVKHFKHDLPGTSSLVSIERARALIGFEPECSIQNRT